MFAFFEEKLEQNGVKKPLFVTTPILLLFKFWQVCLLIGLTFVNHPEEDTYMQDEDGTLLQKLSSKQTSVLRTE